jgi:type IV secretion system protein TrbL
MVLAFIMSLVSPILGQLRFSGAGGELKLNEILSMILVAGMLAFIVWRAPGFASDLLAASPSLGVASVGQHVTSVVSGGANAASGAVTAGLWASRAAATMVTAGAATKAAALKMVASAAVAGARGQGQLPGGVGGGTADSRPKTTQPNGSTPSASRGSSNTPRPPSIPA